MGFATGFTGGVTLTLSVAYLSILAHRRNREAQCEILRAQSLQIRSLLDPPPPPLPSRRSEVAASQREHMVEVAKDRWNAEVLNAVRWVQNTDWTEVREGMEERAGYIWRQAFGGGGKDRSASGPSTTQRTAVATRSAARAKDRTTTGAPERVEMEMEISAENAALDARLRRKDLEDKVGQVEGVILAAVEKGEEEMMGGGTEQREELSAVERALQERFGGRRRDVRSAEEVLRARYVPMDERDNTVLRGL